MGKSLGKAAWDSWKGLATRPENYVLLAASTVVATAYAAMPKATSHIKPSITIYGDVFRFIQSSAGMEAVNFNKIIEKGDWLAETATRMVQAGFLRRSRISQYKRGRVVETAGMKSCN